MIADIVARVRRVESVTFYRFAHAVVLSVCKVVFRVKVVGRDLVPPTGAYIVAPSHRSILDIPFAAFITKRTIRFLAKDDLFELSWLLGSSPRSAR